MPDVIVPVPWALQEELYGCGPAVTQMVLSAFNIPRPGGPQTWQQQLWVIIQSLTWETRPGNAGPGTPYAPSFPTQLCEQCSGVWDCWATSPPALERTLNSLQQFGQYRVTTGKTEEAVTGALLDTLDSHLPGVALVRGRQHWLVVDGYLHSEPNSTPVAGRNLNGVYLRNGQVQSLHYVDWETWEDDYLSFVACGRYENSMVVLDAVRVMTGPSSAPSAPTNIRITR